jgi:ATP-dependent RNA helicase HelY
MAVNLIEQFGRDRTREILESSFAQFQADRAVVDLARTVRKREESLAGYEKAMQCHLGDFREYSGIRRQVSELEKQNSRMQGQSNAAKARVQRELSELRRQLRHHPCHGCAEREQHARWAERWWRLKRETEQLNSQIRSRTGAVARVFDRVSEVLIAIGYLRVGEDGQTTLTPDGRRLRRIYGERDLLVAESLRQGLWDGLDVPSLAAMACALVFEPRRDEVNPPDYLLPKGPFRRALDETQKLWAELDDLEREHRLPGSEPLSVGLAPAMYSWARGQSLEWVLEQAELAAGDFVRWAKQTIDLLDQLSVVADGGLGRTARQALDAVRRGIVAYSSVG